MTTVYDVTTFAGSVPPTQDIGVVINEILADIASNQTTPDTRPGAVIYIPPGHYDLLTTVEIDQSFIQIKGSGHGFLSIAQQKQFGGNWREQIPGGSHVRIVDPGMTGFRVRRQKSVGGGPAVDGRLNSIEFRDFCIDGVEFDPLFVNGKTGIAFSDDGSGSYFADNDSCWISGMGMVFLETGVLVQNADAMSVRDNFITECGTAVKFTVGSLACSVTDNSFGAGYNGFTVFAENTDRLIVSGNQMYPHGKSLVHLKNSNRCTISANMMQSYYSGIITFEGTCSFNSILSNHLVRDYLNPQPTRTDDLFGLIHLRGNDNAVIGNFFMVNLTSGQVSPSGDPTVILIASGGSNYVASNYTIAPTLAPSVAKVVLDGSTTKTNLIYTCRTAELNQISPATVALKLFTG